MKNFIVVPLLAVFLMSATSSLANNSDPNNLISPMVISKNESQQQSGITLSAANLKQPHLLKISANGSQLMGEVKIDKKLLKKIKSNNPEAINLSPYLSVGKHTVEISGNYVPSSAIISIEVSAPGVSMVQESSGNGNLNHTLLINVQ